MIGAAYPVGFRAAEPSRVARLEARDYHEVAAVAPEMAAEVGKLAARPHGRAARPAGHRGREPASARRRVRQARGRRVRPAPPLPRAQPGLVPLGDARTRPTPPSSGAPARCRTTATARSSASTSGKTVVKPQLRRVAELLGLGTEAGAAEYDTVVVGAGPSGLAAAVYGASEGLRTIVVEREAPGGQAGTSSRIENYLGFPSGVSGDELASRALQQARRLGAEILVTREITRIDPVTHEVRLDGGDVLRARTIILACGVTWRRLDIEGFDRLAGKGDLLRRRPQRGAERARPRRAHHRRRQLRGPGGTVLLHARAQCHDPLPRRRAREEHVAVPRRPDRAPTPTSRSCVHTEVAAAHGEAGLEAIDVRDNRDWGDPAPAVRRPVHLHRRRRRDQLAAAADRPRPPRVRAHRSGRRRGRARGVSRRDPYLLETSVPGVFACGDVRSGPVKRVAAAVGEGSMAIAFVHQYLREVEARRRLTDPPSDWAGPVAAMMSARPSTGHAA